MFSYCIGSVKKDLDYQERLLKSFNRRLSRLEKYDGYSLIASNVNGTLRFYLYWREEGKEKRAYLGVDKISIIDDLQEKYYLETAIKACSNNIEELKDLIANYTPLDSEKLSSGMSLAYRDENRIQNLLFKVQRSSEWKRLAQQEKSRYKEYKPEGLRHKTIDGTMTRSKSEALIYNILYAENYTFIYELPTTFGNTLMIPDFTIYDSRRNCTVIIEHMGLMASRIYCESQTEKLQLYISNNWIPNVNLLLTFDDINGNIDTEAIHNMISAIMN